MRETYTFGQRLIIYLKWPPSEANAVLVINRSPHTITAKLFDTPDGFRRSVIALMKGIKQIGHLKGPSQLPIRQLQQKVLIAVVVTAVKYQEVSYGALQQKEMNSWIGPTVKHLWNDDMHVLHKFVGFNINTTAFCLGQSTLHLLLLKSSMSASTYRCNPYARSRHYSDCTVCCCQSVKHKTGLETGLETTRLKDMILKRKKRIVCRPCCCCSTTHIRNVSNKCCCCCDDDIVKPLCIENVSKI